MSQVGDWEGFRTQGKEMVDFIADYYQGKIEGYSVVPKIEPGFLRPQLPNNAPEDPEPFDAVMRDVETKILPGVTHWQHPNFFAYFPANSSPPGLLGDMLSGMINNIGFSWVASPAATELETIVLDWLAKLIELPAAFLSTGAGGGVIQLTASDSVLVALIAARGIGLSRSSSEPGRLERLVGYSSDQAHSCVAKAFIVAGLPPQNLRKIPSDPNTFAMLPDKLAEAIQADIAAGLQPAFCCATTGTTSTCAFDPIDSIGEICEAHGIWLHVDAAYAGSAMICPEFRSQYLVGIERADSFCFNPHKWLLTNFDCSVLWVKERNALIRELSITPEYLRSAQHDQGIVNDYRDMQVPLGRRFRALKLWFVLRMFGAKALREYIRSHCALATEFANLVQQDDRFEIAAPPALGLVCFRAKGSDELNKALLDAVNATGLTFLVHTVVHSKYMIRFAVGSTLTRSEHVQQTWKLIGDVLGALTQPKQDNKA